MGKSARIVDRRAFAMIIGRVCIRKIGKISADDLRGCQDGWEGQREEFLEMYEGNLWS